MSGSLSKLDIVAVLGFDGRVPNGLKVHPDQIHVVFPLGSKICILNMDTRHLEFLSGHSHNVLAIEVSKSGKFVASGQRNHMGFRSHLIVWDWETKLEIVRHDLHKVEVVSLCFSVKEDFIMSLGGKDCGTIVIWNLKKKAALCGSFAIKETTGYAKRILSLRQRNGVFVTCGEQNLRIWSIDQENSRLKVQDTSLGKLRREFTGMCISSDDSILYAGTMSGDVVKIRLNCPPHPEAIEKLKAPNLIGSFALHLPKKPLGKDCQKYQFGVREILILPNDKGLVIGAGDGTVDFVVERDVKMKEYGSPTWPMLRSQKKFKVGGAVTSLQLFRGEVLLIGTENCEIYSFWRDELILLKTCHTNKINDIAFPYQLSLVFATASHESIRVWSTTTFQELLRIIVPNFICAAIAFARDGRSILSGWNDGAIRAFTPLSGKLIYAIPNAHNKGCSALALTSNCRTLVSAGIEGQVRVWKIDVSRRQLIGVLKDHGPCPIVSVEINIFDNEVLTASNDGVCVIWDLIHLCRKQIIYGHSQFICATFHPSAAQILSAGVDRKLVYWEIHDGTLVRDFEASKTGPINSIDVYSGGDYFATGDSAQLVKLWNYKRGEVVCIGQGHAGTVTTVKISPCGKFVVSGGADGGIFIWRIQNDIINSRLEESFAKSCSITSNESSSKKETRKDEEHIQELERSRTNLSSRISECPPIAVAKICASV